MEFIKVEDYCFRKDYIEKELLFIKIDKYYDEEINEQKTLENINKYLRSLEELLHVKYFQLKKTYFFNFSKITNLNDSIRNYEREYRNLNICLKNYLIHEGSLPNKFIVYDKISSYLISLVFKNNYVLHNVIKIKSEKDVDQFIKNNFGKVKTIKGE